MAIQQITNTQGIMMTDCGHLTYCTNIHSGESWMAHFESLKKFVPGIKASFSSSQPFGIGLRLSNEASLELAEMETFLEFDDWLKQEDCYVFTMNGFPYGGFHGTIVKDNVHKPDWTTLERAHYTIRLATILCRLLPSQPGRWNLHFSSILPTLVCNRTGKKNCMHSRYKKHTSGGKALGTY